MATDAATRRRDGLGASAWLTGLVAGFLSAVVTGVVIQFGFDSAVLADGIPAGFGLSGLAAGWAVFLALGGALGLLYGALTRIERFGRFAVLPRTGASAGLVYGLVLWVLAVIVVPVWMGAGLDGIGAYAVNLRGVLAFALLGILIGVIFGVSPYTD